MDHSTEVSSIIIAFLQIVNELREGFESGVLSSIESRKNVLHSIRNMLTENEELMTQAVEKDMHRCKFETIVSEVLFCKLDISHILSNLDLCLKEKRLPNSFVTSMDYLSVQKQPLGVVLIIGAWNFPINLTISPLVGAIAAGNCVLLKPSEYAPASAALLSQLIQKYIDKKICQVVCYDQEASKRLLEIEKFDHIFFTGGSSTGREIYIAAAKKLTPVTLEMGGKCPTYVDCNVKLKMAVKRIVSAKLLNVGQLCVCPDYVLCHQEILFEFKQCVIETIKEFVGDDIRNNPDYGRLINARQFQRVSNLLKNTTSRVVYGGGLCEKSNFVEVTVLDGVSEDDVLMQDELFAPILPILGVKSHNDAIRIIRSKSKPLGIYVFTNDGQIMEDFKQQTSSGAILQNDCSIQGLFPELPFGGIGESGIGSYHGVHSIDTFSHHRTVIYKSTLEFVNNNVRYPPYTDKKLSWFRWLLKKDERSHCNIL